MNKALLLRLHRWITLLFAAPLVVVIGTGLVLSFEPVVHHTKVKSGSLTPERVDSLLARHDPQGRARAIAARPYEDTILIQGVRPGPPVAVDLASGEEARGTGRMTWSDLFTSSRRLHETLLLDMGWLVIASTFAMLALALLGVLMGWPRIRNTVSGWHKGVAWGLLPLLVLSPLTGLAIAYGVTFAPPHVPVAGGGPVPLAEAVRLVGASGRDLSGLVWLRPQGGRMLARFDEGGEWRVYEIAREAGLVPQPRNWPRLLREGNFAPLWPGLINALTAVAALVLLGTGLFMWGRRKVGRWTNAATRTPQPVKA